MVTKIAAAKIATAAGANMVIASGKVMHPLRQLNGDGPCTWFPASSNPVAARKRWIAGTLEPRGTLIIDEGARLALAAGRSLLPAGVKQVSGSFDRGDAVIIRDMNGVELGRGLIAYPAGDAARIMGSKSEDIGTILGYGGRVEMIHRDDMALRRE
jgi:glutamate 5-kinase